MQEDKWKEQKKESRRSRSIKMIRKKRRRSMKISRRSSIKKQKLQEEDQES
jgi:hypothetical protein